MKRIVLVIASLAGLLLVFPGLLEALAETITGRDIAYTAMLGLVIGVGDGSHAESLTAAGAVSQTDMLTVGGGSSFAGLVFPFLDQLDRKGAPLDLVAVESNAVPKVTQGKFTFDHGDSAKLAWGRTMDFLKKHMK